jgi:hypothetical protein
MSLGCNVTASRVIDTLHGKPRAATRIRMLPLCALPAGQSQPTPTAARAAKNLQTLVEDHVWPKARADALGPEGGPCCGG